MAKRRRPDSPDDHQFDYSGRNTPPKQSRTRKLSDMETGRAPKATKWSNFESAVDGSLPRNGTERFPRPQPRSNVSEDYSSNHNDLIRGQGY